jgi:hypothetical protein
MKLELVFEISLTIASELLTVLSEPDHQIPCEPAFAKVPFTALPPPGKAEN